MNAGRAALGRFARGRILVLGVLAAAGALASLAGPLSTPAPAASLTGVDLSTYVRVGRFDLPAPAGQLLAREASAVTYRADTGTLYVVGDGSTSVVQVTKTGQLIDSMTLSGFDDTEGIAHIGGGRFVLAEERVREVNSFTYIGGGTLTPADVQTVDLGTDIGNIGIEGITNDPLSSGFVAVKEDEPQGVFQTGIDFDAGTATNGSSTTENSVNLFDPALLNLPDIADVFSLSNLSGLTGLESANLLLLSQEAGRIVNVNRSGAITSSLQIVADPGGLAVADQGHEGVTMDDDGNLYVVSEAGGGTTDIPQMWVYAPSDQPNQAPTGVTLINQLASVAENTSTATRIKVADVAVQDDGLGTNVLSLTGADAGFFEIAGTTLYLKAGTVLDFEAKSSYAVAVAADDTTLGATPDATSATYTLAVTDIVDENPPLPPLVVSEVSPWSSTAANSAYAADWIELTNTGTAAVDITGFKIDDNSNLFANSVALNGVTSIPAGESAVFIEGDATKVAQFKTAWFGSNVPIGFQMGTYGGGGIGLSNDGDAVNLFDATGNRVTGVRFGASTSFFTFDNAAGAGATELPLPLISTLSVAGLNGAFFADRATGSPGTIVQVPIVSEVSPWSSGNSPAYGSDWFEVTNTGTRAIDISGWRMDDTFTTTPSTVALSGIATIPPGTSVIFLELARTAEFSDFWFGSNPPPGFQIGTYSGGSGVGLSTTGDQVNLFDKLGNRVTGVGFGANLGLRTFDNAAGLGSRTSPVPALTTLSTVGVNGAYLTGGETGSPGTIVPDTTPPTVTYSGNLGTYTVDQQVAIACTATDEPRGSGIASTTCADVSGPAAEFGLGPHAFSATATDNAGNVGNGSGSFTVIVTSASLCNLTRAYVHGSARYEAMKANQRVSADKRVATLCNDVLAAIAGSSTKRKALLNRYASGVAELVGDDLLTQAQATRLSGFAAAL